MNDRQGEALRSYLISIRKLLQLVISYNSHGNNVFSQRPIVDKWTPTSNNSHVVGKRNFILLFYNIFTDKAITFLVWLRNRLLSAGKEPVLSQTEKSCIASNNFLRILKLKSGLTKHYIIKLRRT